MYHIYDIITVIPIYRLINNNTGLVRLFISRYTGMYSRNLLQTKHSGYISDILLPFSRRTYHVRTAKMSLYIENLSQNASFRRLREYINMSAESAIDNSIIRYFMAFHNAF